MLIELNKYIEKNENVISVILTIIALVLIGFFGELYLIGFIIFIFLGIKIIVTIFQLLLLSFITPKQEKAYENKLIQRSKEKKYRETRIGLNISKRDWNRCSTERRNELNILYSNQRRIIWDNFSYNNPQINVYKSNQYFNLIEVHSSQE